MHRRISAVAILLLTAPLSAQTFLGKNTFAWTQELERPDESARRNAAYALGKLGAQAAPAIANVIKRLNEDKSAKVREAAALALGEIGADAFNPSASQLIIPALVKALTDEHHLVRRSAACALGSL